MGACRRHIDFSIRISCRGYAASAQLQPCTLSVFPSHVFLRDIPLLFSARIGFVPSYRKGCAFSCLPPHAGWICQPCAPSVFPSHAFLHDVPLLFSARIDFVPSYRKGCAFSCLPPRVGWICDCNAPRSCEPCALSVFPSHAFCSPFRVALRAGPAVISGSQARDSGSSARSWHSGAG